ncbi:uncharacterized protein A4U43_C08F18950 [Asparagus officinalis]|nr:uncharacterized protein A4U43_C08F18950 [Asparagus officinalis]
MASPKFAFVDVKVRRCSLQSSPLLVVGVVSRGYSDREDEELEEKMAEMKKRSDPLVTKGANTAYMDIELVGKCFGVLSSFGQF